MKIMMIVAMTNNLNDGELKTVRGSDVGHVAASAHRQLSVAQLTKNSATVALHPGIIIIAAVSNFHRTTINRT